MYPTTGRSDIRSRVLALLTALILLAAGVLAVRLSAVADAQTTCEPTGSEIPNAVDDVTLLKGDVNTGTPLQDGDSVSENAILTAKVDWSLKGHQVAAGDWFTYQLDRNTLAAQAIPVFPITDQASGVVIGCGKVASSGLMTVVFNDQITSDAAGYTWASARVTSRIEEIGQQVTIFLQVGNSVTFYLTPGLGPAPIFRKDGWLTYALDAFNFQPHRALTWRIVTPLFDREWDNFHVWDEVPQPRSESDGTWKHNCAETTGGQAVDQPVSVMPDGFLVISDGSVLGDNQWRNQLTNKGVFKAQNGGGEREAEFRRVMDSIRVSCNDGRFEFTVGEQVPPQTQFTAIVRGGFTDDHGQWLTKDNISQINGKTYHNVAYLEADGMEMIQTPIHEVKVEGGGEVTVTPSPTTSLTDSSTTKPTTSTSKPSSSTTSPSTSSSTTPTTTRSTDTGNEGGSRGSLGEIGLGSLDTGSLGVGSLAIGSIATVGIGAWFVHQVCTGVIQIPGLPLPPFCQPPVEPAPQPTPTEVPTAPGPEEDNGRG